MDERQEPRTAAGRALLETVEHLEGFNWKGAILAIEAEAATLSQPEGVRLLARTIQRSGWFQGQKRSLQRNEWPTMAQVVALVDRIAATPPPATPRRLREDEA